MNMDRFKYRYWEHEVWDDSTSPLVAKYTDIVAGCDPTVAVGDFEFCTGLKDKNGNLIYIGDIIKCGNNPLGTATVQYENGENFIDGIYPFNLYHDCGDECHCQLRDYPEYACEIIGNIHEQKGDK